MKTKLNRTLSFWLIACALCFGNFDLAAQSENKPAKHAHKAGEHQVSKLDLKYESDQSGLAHEPHELCG
jgi:hypothetical protein